MKDTEPIIFDLNQNLKENMNIGSRTIKTTNQKYLELYLKFKKTFKPSCWAEDMVGTMKTYCLYPYKKPNIKNNYNNYITKKDTSIHPFTISYEDYVTIIKCFVKHVKWYLAHGYPYRFLSGIGVIKIEKFKPQYLGHNLPKAIKKVVKEQGLSYDDAKTWIKDNRDKVEFEERKNLLLKGFKFKLFWYNKDANIPLQYYWSISLSRNKRNRHLSSYDYFFDLYKQQPEIFNQVQEKIKRGIKKKY